MQALFWYGFAAIMLFLAVFIQTELSLSNIGGMLSGMAIVVMLVMLIFGTVDWKESSGKRENSDQFQKRIREETNDLLDRPRRRRRKRSRV